MSISYPSTLHGIIAAAQKNHFWFQARRSLIVSIISRFMLKPATKRFCEVGFGTGELLSEIEQLGLQATGIDINAEALVFAKKNTRATLVRTSLFTYKPAEKFDAIGLFDVLEHQKNDRKFLQHCARILKPGGLLFITVPAMQWLWGDVDVKSGHIRRYSLAGIHTVLHDGGFSVRYGNYYNGTLVPFIYLRSLMTSPTIDVYFTIPPQFLNTLLLIVLRIEHRLFSHIRLPVGSSIIVAAQKL